MKQQTFEKQHSKEWQEFRNILISEGGDLNSKQDYNIRYKRICKQYALAIDRGYTRHLVEYLHSLVMEGHQLLYRKKKFSLIKIIRFITNDFPCAVRREYKLLFLSCLFFFGTTFFTGIMVYKYPELVYSIYSPQEVASYEKMYEPERHNKFGRERGSDTDIMMFGFYIRNNTGIGLQTFASGVVFGIGTIFTLLFNGLAIGAVSGYLTSLGYHVTLFPFMAGHGSFELTAIVLAGVAGMKIGFALLIPGSLGRVESLKKSAKDIMPVVYGMAGMFIIAAFIEAFWSSSVVIPSLIKYIVGGSLWLMVIFYFLFCGHSSGNR